MRLVRSSYFSPGKFSISWHGLCDILISLPALVSKSILFT